MRASSSRAARRCSPSISIARAAQYVGLTTRDVTNSLVVNLAGSSQIAPTYWLNPANGVSYEIVLQTPQYRLDSLAALSNLPIAAPAASQLQVLGGIADVRRDTANAVVSQYDLQGMVRSMPACRAATSAPSPPTCARSSPSWRPAVAARSARSRSRARSGPWKAPSPACCSACSAPSC